MSDTTVNAANILLVADAIEGKPIEGIDTRWLGFSMANFISTREEDMSGRGCGTTACIMGWANLLSGLVSDPGHAGWGSHRNAEEFLGIDHPTGQQLFYAHNHPEYDPDDDYAVWERIPADQAVRTLRHLAAAGIVDWSA